MFKWYHNAEVCLAYLADVGTSNDLESFKRSEWLRRGWTLQELLAPRTVVFLTQAWEVIGHKGGTGRGRGGSDLNSSRSLTPSISAVSGIPEKVLDDFGHSNELTVDEKLEWIAGRETMREEDMSYSLLGIFGVSMPVVYGEGSERARKRLLEEVHKEDTALARHLQNSSNPLVGAQTAEDITRPKADLLYTKPGPETPSPPDVWVEPILSQAQETFKLARSNYSCGHLHEAHDLCTQALDELSEVRKSSQEALEELMWLFYALVSASIGEPKMIEKSRRLLANVDVHKLQTMATDNVPNPLVLDKMVMICWIHYRLQNTKEAETYCRTLRNDVGNWNNQLSLFYDLTVLLVLITYSQHKEQAGRSLVRIIPKSYLRSQYDRIVPDGRHDEKLYSSYAWLGSLLEQGCETAAIYFLHYEPCEEHRKLALKAAERGLVPMVAMLISRNTVGIITDKICKKHSGLRCPGDWDRCDFDSSWSFAVSRGQMGVVKYVLEELEGMTRSSWPLSFGACIKDTLELDRPEISEVLFNWELENRQNGRDVAELRHPIHLAMSCEATKTLEHLLKTERCVEIDRLEPKSNTTPLVLACRSQRTRMVQFLIEHGASVDGAGRFGESPIHEAVKLGDLRIMQVLVKSGASLNESCSAKWEDLDIRSTRVHYLKGKDTSESIVITPLQYAVILRLYRDGFRDSYDRQGKMETIEYLVSHGASCMSSPKLRYDCMYLAVKEEDTVLLECLVDSSSDLDVDQPCDGRTALHAVLELWTPDWRLVQSLIIRGANPMALYSDGQTCFHRAIQHENALDLLQALRKSTQLIDLSKRDNAGRTAADLARQAIGGYFIDDDFISREWAKRRLLRALRDISAPERTHGWNVLSCFLKPKKDRD